MLLRRARVRVPIGIVAPDTLFLFSFSFSFLPIAPLWRAGVHRRARQGVSTGKHAPLRLLWLQDQVQEATAVQPAGGGHDPQDAQCAEVGAGKWKSGRIHKNKWIHGWMLACLRARSVSARFATDPPLWNWAMVAVARLLPQAMLQDIAKVQPLVRLSMPFVRAVDKLVGERVAIRVDVDTKKGVKATSFYEHESLSEVSRERQRQDVQSLSLFLSFFFFWGGGLRYALLPCRLAECRHRHRCVRPVHDPGQVQARAVVSGGAGPDRQGAHHANGLERLRKGKRVRAMIRGHRLSMRGFLRSRAQFLENKPEWELSAQPKQLGFGIYIE